MHLADFNIAKLLAPIDDPLIDDFRNNLEPLNRLAEESPGFVWRLQDDHGDATSFDPYGDGLTIVNLAVWETVQDLYHFTYRARSTWGSCAGAASSSTRRSSRPSSCGGSRRAPSPRSRTASSASPTSAPTARRSTPSTSATATSRT